MKTSAMCVWRIVAGMLAICLFGVVAAVATTPLTARAQPAPCTASGLANTASGILNAMGGYLDSHPGANDVLTAAAGQSPADARASVRGYFSAHPNEALDLNNMAQPLRDLSKQCNVNVTATQLTQIVEAVSQ